MGNVALWTIAIGSVLLLRVTLEKHKSKTAAE